ncbi:GIY-YIG nuclease superfamily protein [compost metagenome]
MGEVKQEVHRRESGQLGVPLQQHHRPDRIGAPPAEGHPLLSRQALGQDEQAVEESRAGQGAGHPEGHARPELAQEAAQHRPQDETSRKGRADQPVGAGAFFRFSDVSHIGVDGGEAGRGYARDQPPDRQPPQVGRQRHQHIVRRQTGAADQDDRPAPILVRQGADHRRSQELHPGPQGHEHPVQQARARVRPDEFLDQVRQDGDDDPHGHDVQHRSHEDEGDRRATDLGDMQGHGRSRSWSVVLEGGLLFVTLGLVPRAHAAASSTLMSNERPFIAAYMMANRPQGALYIGVTSNLIQRVQQHRDGTFPDFTRKHGLKRLVWYEAFEAITDAIRREKALKRYLRDWKLNLIERDNPHWEDLAAAWFASPVWRHDR